MSRLKCQGASLRPGWWNDPDVFAREFEAHGHSPTTMAQAHPERSRTQYGRLRDKHAGAKSKTHETGPAQGVVKVERAGFEIDGDCARIVTEAKVELGDVESLIRERGLDPADWDIERVKLNEWEAYAGRDAPEGDEIVGEPRIVKLKQLTVNLKRRRTWDFLFPASTAVEGRIFARPKASTAKTARARLEWIGGDQQASYHDRKLHEAVCRWLADVKPDGLNLTGDTIDLPTISRHADRPHWSASPQECLDAGYALLYDYRDAAPDAVGRKLRGNHDWRIESEMLTRAERLWGLRPAKRENEDAQPALYSIRRLLRLDELGIELFGREGDKWEVAEIPLADDLVVRHRPPTISAMQRLNRDIVAGDSHRQRIDHVTTYLAGEPVVRTVVQTGLLAEANGLGYTRDPDWQQGFATVTLHPDGSRAFELATWNGRALTWRGEQWKP